MGRIDAKTYAALLQEAYQAIKAANEDTIVVRGAMAPAVADSPVPGYEYAADNTCEEQVQWIIEAYRWAADQAWIGPMFLWNLDYSLTAPPTPLAYFSILDTPAYDALVEMSRAEDKEK